MWILFPQLLFIYTDIKYTLITLKSISQKPIIFLINGKTEFTFSSQPMASDT